MTTSIFFTILVLLTLGIWIVAICNFWYGRELLKRQKALMETFLPYLKKTEQDKETLKALNIDKNEPLSKYKEVVLPDEVHLSFTEKEK